MPITPEMYLEMYRKMLTIRRFEETAYRLYMDGKMAGVMHYAIGQEAVSVGATAPLRVDDYITSTHRGHGDVIAKGARPDRMLAELMAKSTGYCKAKGGSLHIMDFSQGVLGANGIVAAGVPIASGAGLSIRMRRTDQVVVCFMGDGAITNAAFHEGFHLGNYMEASGDCCTTQQPICRNLLHGQYIKGCLMLLNGCEGMESKLPKWMAMTCFKSTRQSMNSFKLLEEGMGLSLSIASPTGGWGIISETQWLTGQKANLRNGRKKTLLWFPKIIFETIFN